MYDGEGVRPKKQASVTPSTSPPTQISTQSMVIYTIEVPGTPPSESTLEEASTPPPTGASGKGQLHLNDSGDVTNIVGVATLYD
jgi:hypothetical protein